MNKILIILPIILYLLLTLYIAYRVNKIKQNSSNFTEEYYIGNRSMGGFVLAMTIIATYIGASSFIGGPGVAYKLGLGWVLLACIQVPTAFFTLGILGKKMSIISRKINAVTIFDLLKKRYDNDAVNILSSIMLLIFFIGAVVAQFVGGARLFEAVTGLSYVYGLIIFSMVVIIYTTLGGFRAVTLTDAIQATVMFIATFILFFVILKKGNGMENIMLSIKNIDPNLLRPDSGGNIAKPFIMSFWILVGIGILGLPATTVRCMAFKDSKAMHNAMIIGTSLVGILVLGMHLVGVMAKAVEPNLDIADKIIPILALKNLYPILAGVFIGGPLAAIMSTVDSLLIMASSTIIKDLYISYFDKKASEEKVKKISMFTSFFIGILVFLLSLKQLSLIVWINLFALAGQEIIFFCPLILGLYWKKANSIGAIASMVFGITTYLYIEIFKVSVFGLHNVVPSLAISLIAFIVGSLLGKKPSDDIIETFFEY
ncbi:MAG: sodium/pantothenate symporter [Fusobacterium sp.]|uniref:sodium/pantothenate symporter n=1 Tax=Fusobacterium sp. TaxID=68766 RepID=UPI0026DD8A20|nr:sodium/pantothenate symporter [Fusobacterium sp.]MDO4690668.1 sodium/pantothenate symporter [Fusobacterium sp.]